MDQFFLDSSYLFHSDCCCQISFFFTSSHPLFSHSVSSVSLPPTQPGPILWINVYKTHFFCLRAHGALFLLNTSSSNSFAKVPSLSVAWPYIAIYPLIHSKSLPVFSLFSLLMMVYLCYGLSCASQEVIC